jgi:hypothetical protein
MPRTRATFRLWAGLLGSVLITALTVGTAGAGEPPVRGTFDRQAMPDVKAVIDRAAGMGRLSRMADAAAPVLHDVPPKTIGPASSLWFVDDMDGAIVFFGEVWNRTNQRVGFVSLDILLRNASGVIVGTGRGSVALYTVASGARAIFSGYVEKPRLAWTTYDISVATAEPVTAPVGGPLGSELQPRTVDSEGTHYAGTFTNLNPFKVNDTVVYLSQYDSSGRIVDIWGYFFAAGIPAGDTAAFEFMIPEELPGVVRSSVIVEAFKGFPSSFADIVYSWPNYFDDIGSSVHRSEILWNAEQGITAGCGEGLFCPQDSVPRDEMASFLSRAVGLGGTAPNAFTDDAGNPHEANINRVAAAGITAGCGGTNYCPATPVSRDQMASFLSRAVGLAGSPADAFGDDNGNIHETSINRVAEAGIATGCKAAMYCPSALVTRGQMASFLKRAFD